MNRYFHVSYAYTADNGSFGFGSSQTRTMGGMYLNKEKFIKDTIESNGNNSNYRFVSVVILNVLEVNEKDFEDFLTGLE